MVGHRRPGRGVRVPHRRATLSYAACAPAEYGDRYYMITPVFETGDDRYGWLNGLVCVGEGKPAPGGVAHRIYALVND